MTAFGREVKPSATCRNILRHVKDPYSTNETLIGQIHGNFSPSFSCFTTRYLLVTVKRALVGESENIRTQMGKHDRLVMVAVYGTPDALGDTTSYTAAATGR
jgi:hypothetical protein